MNLYARTAALTALGLTAFPGATNSNIQAGQPVYKDIPIKKFTLNGETQIIDIKTGAVRLGDLVKVFADKAKKKDQIIVDREIADEAILVRAEGISVEEFKDRLAAAASAEWQKDDKGILRLVRTRAIKDKLAKDALAQKTLDIENALQASGQTPLDKVVSAIGAGVLAQLPIGEPAVFTNRPNTLQRGFPEGVKPALTAFLDAHKKQLPAGFDLSDNKILLNCTPNRSRGTGVSWEIQCFALRNGTQVMLAETEPFVIPAPSKFTLPAALRQPMTFAHDAKSLDPWSLLGKNLSEQPKDANLQNVNVPLPVRNIFVQNPEGLPGSIVNQITDLMPGHSVFANLPPDSYAAAYQALVGTKTAPVTAENMARQLMDSGKSILIYDAEKKSISIKPSDPLAATAARADTAALQKFFPDYAKNGMTLDNLGKLAKGTSIGFFNTGTCYVQMAINGVAGFPLSHPAKESVLRVFGELDSTAQATLLAQQSIEILPAQISPSLRRAICHSGIMHIRGGGATVTADPTEFLPQSSSVKIGLRMPAADPCVQLYDGMNPVTNPESGIRSLEDLAKLNLKYPVSMPYVEKENMQWGMRSQHPMSFSIWVMDGAHYGTVSSQVTLFGSVTKISRSDKFPDSIVQLIEEAEKRLPPPPPESKTQFIPRWLRRVSFPKLFLLRNPRKGDFGFHRIGRQEADGHGIAAPFAVERVQRRQHSRAALAGLIFP